MKKDSEIREKEELFCSFILRHYSPKEAAAKAGYKLPLISGIKLCSDKKIQRYLKKHESLNLPKKSEVADGLRRIAFGTISDAIRLMSADNISELNPDTLDLINVAELKIPKGGGIEIKFFDRIKALERLGEFSEIADEGIDNSFFSAIENSAKRLENGGVNEI